MCMHRAHHRAQRRRVSTANGRPVASPRCAWTRTSDSFETARVDPAVVGLVLTGSRGRGPEPRPDADWDVRLVLRDADLGAGCRRPAPPAPPRVPSLHTSDRSASQERRRASILRHSMPHLLHDAARRASPGQRCAIRCAIGDARPLRDDRCVHSMHAAVADASSDAPGSTSRASEAKALLDRRTEAMPLFARSRFRRCVAQVGSSLALGDRRTARDWARAA